ncbi:unnamed protein product [Parnassius apollo]|uniref:(apollo) hypothetical protein n=1 Tax=Parnassius apollo TaxID=110799 RepID=A0A8S3VZX2_PARAO|nr:unnamed protein product [Parnassius apollo]
MNIISAKDTYITKFNINDKVIYAKIMWKRTENSLFEIKVFDDNSSWSGCFSTELAEKCRKDVDESEDDYYKNVRTYLSNISDLYVYEFSNALNDSDVATFKWRKKFEGETAVLVHGYVFLYCDKITENKNVLIDFLLRENMLQKKEIEEYQNQNENLKIEVDKLNEELTKFADLKNSLEDTLYGKFVTLLNTKKRRIQHLEDHLKNYEETK